MLPPNFAAVSAAFSDVSTVAAFFAEFPRQTSLSVVEFVFIRTYVKLNFFARGVQGERGYGNFPPD